MLTSIWNNHLLPFVGYLAAFFSPVSVVLITLQILVWGQLVTGWAAATASRKRDEPISVKGFSSILIKTGVYVFVILILRVCELEVFAGIPVTKVLGGYWVIRELKVNLDYASVIIGYDIWAEIMKVVNKIKI